MICMQEEEDEGKKLISFLSSCSIHFLPGGLFLIEGQSFRFSITEEYK